MFMFLPFLAAFGASLAIILKKRTLSYFLWGLTAIVVVLSFQYHATDALNLSF